MKRVRTSELVPGMITYEDVYSYNNQLIVQKGTVLDDNTITKLEFYSVLSVRIEDEVIDTVNAEDDFHKLPESLPYSERIKSTRQFKEFEREFVNNTEALKGNLNAILKNHSINTDVLLSSVTNLISKSSTSISMFDMLHNMRNYDDFTYVHSMNVSLICNIFGHWLNMSTADIQVLTLAGLLHDIGKLLVPEEIIKKPGKLTDGEFSVIKTHTLQGYNVLKNMDIDTRIKAAALMHHERCDGSGYPLGYHEIRIVDFAKIVAIADVYDAMTAARCYRGPMCPFTVISIFEEEGLQKYDSKYILEFLNHIGETYMNNRVKLNNGMEGDIIMLNKNLVSRPLIRCTDGSFLNLAEHKELHIVSLV